METIENFLDPPNVNFVEFNKISYNHRSYMGKGFDDDDFVIDAEEISDDDEEFDDDSDLIREDDEPVVRRKKKAVSSLRAKKSKTSKRGGKGAKHGPSTSAVEDFFGFTSTSFGAQDYSSLDLKPDHRDRPIFVCPDRTVFLETWSPVYAEAYDFLIAIAEPLSRPSLMHEYKLTPHSLLAAVSVGLESDDIVNVLEMLSKVRVPTVIKDYIFRCTKSFGKASLVLRDNRFFIESRYAEALEGILSNSVVRSALVRSNAIRPTPIPVSSTNTAVTTTTTTTKQSQSSISDAANIAIPGVLSMAKKASDSSGETRLAAKLNKEDNNTSLLENEESLQQYEIRRTQVDEVKRECVSINSPLLEEFDFRRDAIVTDLPIELKGTTSIRPYQEKSLSKMFGNGRARSGIVVLPCGAGKTLVGITAACTIGKSVLVLCTSAVAVEQWRNQFKLWSTAVDDQIVRFTSDTKGVATVGPITITTYTMVAFSGKRSAQSDLLINQMKSREWGLLILDEVHVVPADTFRTVLTICSAHTKLGLTATLVREDELIADLYWLIGPKLYEANWLDLQRSGHIARVQCAEVWCEMEANFYREYLRSTPNKRKLLYIMNPYKFRTTHFLINYHERRGDKILVFSDNVEALVTYATRLKKYFICGPTPQQERLEILEKFRYSPSVSTIFISKVGDNSIDLPEANVIIQVSSHYGSRRQEAQRLGRILRPKQQSTEEYNAFFYSLVSRDTQEMAYSTKRQQFLLDQGYAFRLIPSLLGNEPHNLVMETEAEKRALLRQVLSVDDKMGETEAVAGSVDDMPLVDNASGGNRRGLKRPRGSLSGLARLGSRLYIGQTPGEPSSASTRKATGPAPPRSKFFKNLDQKKLERAQWEADMQKEIEGDD